MEASSSFYNYSFSFHVLPYHIPPLVPFLSCYCCSPIPLLPVELRQSNKSLPENVRLYGRFKFIKRGLQFHV